ncbi:hypothetical protein Tco_1537255 [Tanacetum coccineum]
MSQKAKSIDTHEGTGLKLGVPDVSKANSSDSEYESWGVSDDDDDDDQQGDDESTESDDDKSIDLNKTEDEEETREDEFVHTPDDYMATDDETKDVDDEEYIIINEEMYDDVNVELKDAEVVDEGKGDEEMIDAENVNVEHEEVNQENEVKDLKNIDHSSTLLATIKSEVPTTVKEYLGTSLDEALYKVLQRHTAEFIKEYSVLADVIELLK